MNSWNRDVENVDLKIRISFFIGDTVSLKFDR